MSRHRKIIQQRLQPRAASAEVSEGIGSRGRNGALALDQTTITVEHDQAALADQNAFEPAVADHFVDETSADASQPAELADRHCDAVRGVHCCHPPCEQWRANTADPLHLN